MTPEYLARLTSKEEHAGVMRDEIEERIRAMMPTQTDMEFYKKFFDLRFLFDSWESWNAEMGHLQNLMHAEDYA